jgi:hypothetical protein
MENNDFIEILENPTDQTNGLLTKIWGPSAWKFLHAVTFGYPVNPSIEQKNQYKAFFKNLGFVLPCIYCRDSYQKFIECNDTILNDDVFESRETITKWLYKLHNRVNEKLGMTYETTYEHVCTQNEAYRAKCTPKQHGCNMPLDIKAQSFRRAEEREAPIISSELALCFSDYAKKKGIDINIEINKCIEYKKNKNSKEWKNRNKKCWEIIDKMRNQGISPTEQNGLLTNDEILLISMLCSNLCKNDLHKITEKMGFSIITKYVILDKNIIGNV